MKSEEKALQVEAFKSLYNEAPLFVVAENRGLDADQTRTLRKKVYLSGGKLKVFKNTLVQRGMGEDATEDISSQLKGPNAYMFGGENFVEDLKVLMEFSKEHKELFVLKCGLMDKEFMSAEKLKVLSTLPSKDELRAQVCAQMLAPVTGFVNVLAGNVRSIVNVLNNIKDQKESN